MSSDRDPARIRFEFSAADLADVARRSADRSKTVRDQRWHAAASWSALLALVLFFALDGSFIARAAMRHRDEASVVSGQGNQRDIGRIRVLLVHRWTLGCAKPGVSDFGTACGFLVESQTIPD